MKAILEAGKVCNVHGVRGQVKIFPWTDSPYVYDNFSVLFIDNKEYKVLDVKYNKNFVIAKLKGIDTVEQAQLLREKIVYCYRKDFGKLKEGTYFVADLISCEVVENGVVLGKITDVINNGASDLYEIYTPDKTTIYLPAVKENILSVDIQNKIIEVRLPKGLLE
jgi:16S rRNA processing protein RimM